MPAERHIGALRVSLGLDSAQFETGLKSAQGKLASFGKAAGLGLAGRPRPPPPPASPSPAASSTRSTPFDELSKTSPEDRRLDRGAVRQAEVRRRPRRRLDLDQLTTAEEAQRQHAGGGPPTPAAASARRRSSSWASRSPTPTAGCAAGTRCSATSPRPSPPCRTGRSRPRLPWQIFGKSGADLIPLLNAGKAGLKEMGDEAARFGLVIDEKTGKSQPSSSTTTSPG
jgi:hypothetical protein